MKRWVIGIVAVVAIVFAGQAQASIDVGIFHADGAPPVAELNSLGLFSSVSSFDTRYATPTLAQLQNYDAVLAYTNSRPTNPVGLGNVLADYVDAGGHLVLATYSFSSNWDIQGRIMTPGYSPLTNVGSNADVSGNLAATVPSDPIFDGINVSAVSFFHNSNFAHPGLDSGATLLATDGAGTNMIARNASGDVVGVNLFPSNTFGNNAEMYALLGNTLLPNQSAVPEPGTCVIWFLLASLSLTAGWYRRRKTA